MRNAIEMQTLSPNNNVTNPSRLQHRSYNELKDVCLKSLECFYLLALYPNTFSQLDAIFKLRMPNIEFLPSLLFVLCASYFECALHLPEMNNLLAACADICFLYTKFSV